MRFLEKPFAVPAFLLLLCLGVYANTIGNGFHWEDEVHVEKNVHIRTLKNLPVFFRPGYINVYESGLGQRYRPLRTVSFVLDYKLWGMDPRGYHLTNILLHSGVCLTLWFFFRAAGLPLAAAFWACVLFAVHPVHAESIAYIKNRSDLICALFFFWSLALFSNWLRSGGKRLYWGSVLCAGLAFISKEMALALPPAAAGLYLLLRPGRPDRQYLLRAGAALSSFFLLLAAYWLFKETVMGSTAPSFPGTAWDRLWTIVRTLGGYLKVLFLPLKLSLDHNFPLFGPPDAVSAALLLGGVSYAGWAAWRKAWAELFWASLFFLLLAPVSNLVFIQGRSFAEQRVYLASAAFCALLGLWLARLTGREGWRRLLAPAAACLLAAAFAGRLAARNADWKDEVTLWKRTAETDPSARSFYNLSVTLYRRKDYSGAIAAARRSIELDPQVPDGHNTLGSIYYKMGLLEQSLASFQKGLSLSDHKEYVILSNIGSVYGALNRHEEAVRTYLRVVSLAPWFDAGFYNMSLSLEKLGRKEEAERALAEAITLNPYNAEAHMKLGQLLAARGELRGAQEVYRRLLERVPGYLAAAEELERLTSQSPPLDKAN